MKKLLIVFFICIFALPAIADEPKRSGSICQHQHAGTLFSCSELHQRKAELQAILPGMRLQVPPYYPGRRINFFEFSLPALPGRLPSVVIAPGFSAMPFHKSAVFCRMENHFLNRYGVKFSIHAGGYHE